MQNVLITALMAAIMGSSAVLFVEYNSVSNNRLATIVPTSEVVTGPPDEFQDMTYSLSSQRDILPIKFEINSIEMSEFNPFAQEDNSPSHGQLEDNYICLHFPNGSCSQDISIVSYGDFQTQSAQ